MSSSSTATLTSLPDQPRPSIPLQSSTHSTYSASSRQSSSHISKTYRSTSNLFLTRQLLEALDTLEPLVCPQVSEEIVNNINGDVTELAPIASASRTSRTKVWNLYITLLDAIIQLGSAEGRDVFGSQRWRTILAKARDGSIWEDVVHNGYNGLEGTVDAEVVSSLITLLLAHSPSQALTQQRVKNYLSSSGVPNYKLFERLSAAALSEGNNHDQQPGRERNNGTDIPRDLASRLKILELYTLHVLPRNLEWEYAKDFLSNSDILDDEHREVFLQALQSVQDDNIKATRIEADRNRQEAAEKERKTAIITEESLTGIARHTGEASHASAESERNYGIETSSRSAPRAVLSKAKKASATTQLSPTSPPSRPSKGTIRGPTLTERASAVVGLLADLVASARGKLKANPLALLRTLLFIIGLLLTLSRRDIRDRIRRITATGWTKVKGTVGMGVKVSYI